MSDAIVFSGGAARAAFEAGALATILKEVPDLTLTTLVAASGGALNAAYLASAIRRGTDLAQAGEALEGLWLSEATWSHLVHPNVLDILSVKGVSDNAKMEETLHTYITPSTSTDPKPIDLVMAVTNLWGEADDRGDTTFEHVARFSDTDFDHQVTLEAVFAAVTASGAFPGAFAPVTLTIGGVATPCVDGGAVNNNPIKYALENPTVDRVFVLVPFPKGYPAPSGPMTGFTLIAHLADIVINERLCRDLRRAYAINDQLKALAAAFPNPADLQKATVALGWQGKRPVTIVEVRPELPLAGSSFSALSDLDLRHQYIVAGEIAAAKAIA